MKQPDDSPYPTILLIDSTDREQTKLALLASGDVIKSTVTARAQELPKLIEEFLSKNNSILKKLSALAVITKGGSLTGMRIGVAAVNTLAWHQRLPIIEIAQPGFEKAIDMLRTSRYPKATRIITEVD